MDKRRGSKQTEGDADEDSDEVRGAFHAVDMSAVPSRARRESRSASHGAARAESWMARVSTAMSHRIFSAGGGGRRLSGSRSTQVMPMKPVGGHDGRSDAGNGASVGVEGGGLAASSSENSFLASMGSKAAAPTAPTPVTTEVVGFEDVESQDDASLDACLLVACDVASSDDEKEADASDRKRQRQVDRSRHRRRAERVEWAAKVAPNRSAPAFDDDEEVAAGPAGVRVGTLVSRPGVQRQLSDREMEESDDDQAAATPAVLKDFFSRTPSVGVEIRDQQRRARREAHYRRIRERQDELRGRLEREDARAAVNSMTDSDRRRLKAQQLRRRSVARRLELRREAAAAQNQVLARVREEDERGFRSAREHWERDFQDEILALSDAFRRARARNQCARGEVAATDEELERPMTVAGLAVPEALTEIHRELNNADKRVKSAGDSPSPTRLKAVAQRVVAEARTRTLDAAMEEAAGIVVGSDRSADEEADEEEEKEEQEKEEELEMLLEATDDMEGVAIDLPALLGERERLLQRVADIDRLVDVQRRLGLLSDA